MSLPDRSLITGGKILAALSIGAALVSMAFVAVFGGWDFFFDQGVVHVGILAMGFGALGWMTIDTETRNGAVWALAIAAFFGAFTATGFAVIVGWGQKSFPDFSFDIAAALTPADLPLPVALAMQPVAWGWLPTFFIVFTVGLLLFPDGKPPSPRWIWTGWYSVAAMAISVGFTGWLARPSATESILMASESALSSTQYQMSMVLDLLVTIGAVLGIAALVARYRRSSGVVRRQIRWIGWGAAFASVGVVLALVTAETSLAGTGAPVAMATEVVLIAAFAVAITKYRLYDIDIVISRTVAYLTLAIVIAALYVGAVFGLAALFGDSGEGLAELGVGFWFGATALVAFVFEPLRGRLQRLANRLVYGQRAAPHEVLSQLTSQLGDTSRGEGLADLARLLREGTGADAAVVWLRVGNRLRVQATAPMDWSAEPADVITEKDLPASELALSVPVRHGGELLGALGISKSRSHPVTPADETLLNDVAAGAGLLLRNMRLNAELATRAAELRTSRRRLIAVHDAARHRLERDLHDGAQQQVVALKVRLGIAKTVAEREGAPELASRVGDLADGVQQAVDAMRAVARGIYPPLLDAEGLAAALGATHRSIDLPIAIELGTLPRYSKAIEESAYFWVLGVLNRAKMNSAATARVAVHGDDTSLTINVTYDATSGPDDISELTDRVDAFGGIVATKTTAMETTLTLTLPVGSELMEPA